MKLFETLAANSLFLYDFAICNLKNRISLAFALNNDVFSLR